MKIVLVLFATISKQFQNVDSTRLWNRTGNKIQKGVHETPLCASTYFCLTTEIKTLILLIFQPMQSCAAVEIAGECVDGPWKGSFTLEFLLFDAFFVYVPKLVLN